MLRLFGRPRNKEKQLDELLSAYLDGELREGEQERLEARLSRDPSLRAELRAMHHTVSLVRELPSVKAPRNYILTESMVGRRQATEEAHRARPEPQRRMRAWAAPLLTAATAAVSLLFMVVLVGDLLLPGAGGLASAPAPMRQREQAPKIALEAAPTDETPSGEIEMEKHDGAELASPPPASVESAPALPAEESVEEPEMVLEAEEADVEATEADQAPSGAVATPTPAAGGGVTEEVGVPTATTVGPTVTSVTAVTPTIPLEAPEVSEDELGLGEPTSSEVEVTPQRIQEEARGADGLALPSLPWNLLEIALGVASLTLAFATVRAWRVRR